MSAARILTVRQPWAWAIINGGKDVENRSTNIAGDYRGPVLIHVAKAFDESAFEPEHPMHGLIFRACPRSGPDHNRYICDWCTKIAPARYGNAGEIIGVVDLVDVHHAGHCYAESIDRAANLYRTDRDAFDALPVVNGSGGLLGRADYCSQWADATGYHLVLANPRALDQPFPYKGALGLRKTEFFVSGDWLGEYVDPGHSACTPYGCPPECGSEPVARLVAAS